MQKNDMKVGDPVMRVFRFGDNWIGIVTWINMSDGVVEVRWSHGLDDAHDISLLTEVI